MRLRQPILMLTARREEADKILGLEIGADDYLTKPYSPGELLAWVRLSCVGRTADWASENANTLYAGDLVIDRGRAHVSRGNKILNVTPTEFRMLVYSSPERGAGGQPRADSGRRVGVRRRHSERTSRQRPHPTAQREGRA